MTYVFDIECDALHATRMHCFSRCLEDGSDMVTYRTLEEVVEFLSQKDLTLVGHNIIRYDIPTIERLTGKKVKARLIDTLPISWYLETNRAKHGLESYGEDFGIPKPKIDDWENLTFEEYKHRCEEDVKINTILWKKQRMLLNQLYDGDDVTFVAFVAYLSFKMDCVREQEQVGVALDKELCQTTLTTLEQEKALKMEELKAAMPKVPITAKRKVPKVLYKADGALSARGKEWFALLEEMKLPIETEEVEVIREYEEPNPNSTDQLKKWLYGLGWVPEHLKYVRDKEKGTVRQIPQIASKQGGGEICDSVKRLIEKEPSLKVLEGLSVLSHRIALFKGFLENEKDGRLYATCSGLTNTLRLQHSVIVNLPGVDRKYGKEIRGCLKADENSVMCGSDLSGIEDNTKRHYIYKFDPKYVEEMNKPDYDPHLEIAMLAGFLTPDQVQAHKDGKENHKAVRQKGKMVNFSATYKVGAETLSRNSGMSLEESKKLLRIYWERNNAILKVEQELLVKTIQGNRWLKNPISGFWYSLRSEKDRFSTLNQGSAVFVFDVWIMHMRSLGIRICLQMHDEVLFNLKSSLEDDVRRKIEQAMEMTNNQLKLNVKIGCSVQFGHSYSDCH